MLLELRRGGDFGERGDRRGGDGGVLRPDDLGFAVLGLDAGLVFVILWIGQEIESAVGVLEF